MSASASARPIEFRNAPDGTTIAVLQETEPAALADALHKMLGGMPDFFAGEELVLDFGALGATPKKIDWAGLLPLLRRYQLKPVGVRNLDTSLCESARQAGLAVIGGDDRRVAAAASSRAPRETPPPAAPAPQSAAQPAAASAPAPEAVEASAAAVATLFVDRMVRSGQQIYARGGDLVLLGGVSPGAEVIADGSIHCYGPLRGRAIAGARGDLKGRIFATDFGPELVSIAGVYRTFEGGIPSAVAGRPAQIRLDAAEQKLSIEALKLD
ncbi:MAG: septum site-determining protein MinC [Thauera phenolivorans]|uniref:Probable septum site-determining protein MinC n=1 Tax=Thauera phenolivorans TaxID=1792543 RepID=A0A7X7LWR0_9RHOO|nr:septum site-determining protein MinC [Thauera phenolivorans]NLF54291.1 septum site-determining protein MinC [Thauera phenolivorans]